ncbi:MAG: hypothetical protein EXS08_11260 [Planctomycetes bacterium]|nr:hypothetical protein [Planctomycetota bacterium]
MTELALACFVRPRVIDAAGGGPEPVRIEDAIERRLERGEERVLRIEGPPGSGKSTALEYLRLYFHGREDVCVTELEGADVVCVGSAYGAARQRLARCRLELVPWSRDEWIEYLLARHREVCCSVMARLERADEVLDLKGRPLLWAAVLDELARDAELESAHEALGAAVRARFTEPERQRVSAAACWRALVHPSQLEASAHEFRALCVAEPAAAPFLAQSCVHLLLAAEHVAETLALGGTCTFPYRLSRPLLRAARPLLCAQPAARTSLERVLSGEAAAFTIDSEGALGAKAQACAASLLHLYGPTAVSTTLGALAKRGAEPPKLARAELEGLEAPGAALSGIELAGACLRTAQLDAADLSGANLSRSDLHGASLRGAKLVLALAQSADLSEADLRGASLEGAAFGNANLSGARLEGALLRRAQLEGAVLRGALLDNADLSEAQLSTAVLAEASMIGTNLSGARLDGVDLRHARLDTRRFAGASLARCNLEELHIEAPDFSRADLHEALLSGSRFPRALLHAANLSGAGLAHIEWEGANLTHADLTHASFHLGSSRSGLVLSAPASWGTRTGFYRDDLRDQNFKAPEEIRKANLRNADLRGARIEDADFYLVDLRGARYSSEQERHLRGCGAIL